MPVAGKAAVGANVRHRGHAGRSASPRAVMLRTAWKDQTTRQKLAALSLHVLCPGGVGVGAEQLLPRTSYVGQFLEENAEESFGSTANHNGCHPQPITTQGPTANVASVRSKWGNQRVAAP